MHMRIPANIKFTDSTNKSRKRFEIEHEAMPSVMIVVDQFGINWQGLGSQHLPAVEMFISMITFAKDVYTQNFTCWNGCTAPVVGNLCGAPLCNTCFQQYVDKESSRRHEAVRA
jgi:hypothetical protein